MKYTSGELKIKNYLKSKSIKFKPQYKVKINNKIHIFDFAIADRRGIRAFIEYDGEQHFKPVVIYGGEEGFKERQIRDKEKDDFCKINNIPLIRIPYFIKDFKGLLNRHLKDLNKFTYFEIPECKQRLPFEEKEKNIFKKIINKFN